MKNCKNKELQELRNTRHKNSKNKELQECKITIIKNEDITARVDFKACASDCELLFLKNNTFKLVLEIIVN